ncbi:MAG: L,D-transpeptidase family protein [Acidobacteria bacterium]|nr:L,D-transpeptidase family protein [Acidobacteriota bacterium]
MNHRRSTRCRGAAPAVVLCLWLVSGTACGRDSAPAQEPAASQPTMTAARSTEEAAEIALGGAFARILEEGVHPDLVWPDFRDYRGHVQRFYEGRELEPAWSRGGRVTAQARTAIAFLREADDRGLHSEDYDGSRWNDRVRALDASTRPAPSELALFDLALTISVMRCISDLHIGRINPRNLSFGLDVEAKKYDLPALLEKLVVADDPRALLESVEPPFEGYKALKRALVHYRELAAEGEDEPLPEVERLEPGSPYPASEALAHRLVRLGDLEPTAAETVTPGLYDGVLVEGVQRFQARHGLGTDGKLGPKTFRALNTPLAHRVEQIQWTLERWRWAPFEYPRPPIVVNVPEFVLRAYGPDDEAELTMNVVVGEAYHHETPIFAAELKYLVFRPTWTVPFSIQRRELMPKINADPAYPAANGYDVVAPDGSLVTDIDEEALQGLRSGRLTLRQRPGADNSLGRVKFIFPNEHDVYLHGTPAQSLFSRSRRDFSHGCIRLERPEELARWVLKDRSDWPPERIRSAMNGDTTIQVNLTAPIPVLIVYGTAVASADGGVSFFDDIYGHDETLAQALAGGYPYPA